MDFCLRIIYPYLYGEQPQPCCGVHCSERDEMERRLFAPALERDKPVLGICRGLQFINVALGGTLYQDLPTQHPSNTDHRRPPPYDAPTKQLGRCNGIRSFPFKREQQENFQSFGSAVQESVVPAGERKTQTFEKPLKKVLAQPVFVWYTT